MKTANERAIFKTELPTYFHLPFLVEMSLTAVYFQEFPAWT